jgi:acyl carrier protein
MSTNNANETIRGFILEKFPLAKKKGITDNTPLLENGVLDSMGVLDLVEFIEGEFKIGITDEDLLPENFRSVAEIAAFIQNRSQSGVC